MEEYSLKQNLNVLLHSTFEYHSMLAENTFEYLAIEFPFKANHPWDRWLAGPLSLTLGLLVPSQVLNFFGSFSTFKEWQDLCIDTSKTSKLTLFHFVKQIFWVSDWDGEIPADEGRGGRSMLPEVQNGRIFSVVEVNWKLFKGNATPVLSGRRV